MVCFSVARAVAKEDETHLGLLILTCFSVSCAVAKEDETPMGIAERFGIDVDCLCKMNVDMYQGLHPRARFKNGTLLMLPTPTPGSLKRPATRPPLQILKDLVGVVRIEMQVSLIRASHSRFCSKRTMPGSLRIAHIAYDRQCLLQQPFFVVSSLSIIPLSRMTSHQEWEIFLRVFLGSCRCR